MYYRKKIDKRIEAYPWYQNGDHPEDRYIKGTVTEGAIVRRYRRPDVEGRVECYKCGYLLHDHGWIDGELAEKPVGEDVCPGSYVVTSSGIHPEHGNKIPCYYAISKIEFEEHYTKDNQEIDR